MNKRIRISMVKLSTLLFLAIMPLSSYCFEPGFQKNGDTLLLYTPHPKPAPRINGPMVYGCRPGNPFLYRIPCQGERPIRFSAEGLPDGLKLDPAAGIITGTSPLKGDYNIVIKAKNPKGTSTRKFKIAAGDKLALTPPMGWNHWYAHYNRITDKMIREAADEMISSGMADVGYQYVNIDDCWMNAPKSDDSLRVGPLRDKQGNIIPNKHFPDMKNLTDYIHSMGLKAGIYTSPGPLTCGSFAGSYQHEEQDARQFAAWGFDFLKYDWCSYGEIIKNDTSIASYQKPYRQMGNLLKSQDRDIVFNLCQYGMSEVWKWGGEVGGHCWRTSGDLGFELDKIFDVAINNSKIRQYSKPGEWNDPDYIQIGWIGTANKWGNTELSLMPAAKQYAYMSLWSLLAAPLIYSGDMSKLDEFTLNVLCNPEVIDVNQDQLGESGFVIEKSKECFIMVKNLADGSLAIGLFNRGKEATEVICDWSELHLSGKQSVRDLWRQKELGIYKNSFTAQVLAQGVVMVKISKP